MTDDYTATLTTDRTGTYLHINAGGAQHVYPIAYFDSLAAGEDVEPVPPDVLRVFVREWLEWLTSDRDGNE